MDKIGDILVLFGERRKIIGICKGHSEVAVKRGRGWVVELVWSHMIISTAAIRKGEP